MLAAPLTPDTQGIIGEAAIAALKPGAWVINVARGELVDERALARALRDGRLGGAVLDTFREEPLPASSPLYDLPNVILTPHTSWSSTRVLDRSVGLFCENLRRYAAGRAAGQRRRPDRGVLTEASASSGGDRHNQPMQIAIVGLAGAGKTTVFNTLTRGHAETGGYGGLQLNVGVVKVPDERLGRLAEVFHPKKIVHADVTYVDLPAPPASSEGRVGTDELPAEHLARLREADALIHVVRAWDDAAHPHAVGVRGPGPRPRAARPRVHARRPRDDRPPPGAAQCRRRPPRHAGGARGERARGGDPRAAQGRARGRAARSATRPSTRTSEKAIRGFRFLTQKPVLVLLNVGEGDLARRTGADRADHGGLRPPPRDGRRAVGEDRDGAGRARARRGGGVHGGARARRVEPRPGHRACPTGWSA